MIKLIPKNKTVIEVVDRNNTELSSTHRCRHIRHLLKSGRAVIVSFAPFTVKLLYPISKATSKPQKPENTPDFKLVRFKEKLGYTKFISEYPNSMMIADCITKAISTLEPFMQDVFDYVALKTIAANYYYQANIHTIFNVQKYIRACAVNYFYQKCADEDLLKEMSEKLKKEELDRRLEKIASRNKFNNFEQRGVDYWEKAFQENLASSML